MVRFGVIAASLSLLIFYVIANDTWLPVVTTVMMPLADGTPAPVLTGLDVTNFIWVSIIGVASGVGATALIHALVKQLTPYLRQRSGASPELSESS